MVTVTVNDAAAEPATATFTITSKIVLSPASGTEDVTVTVTGSGYSGTAALTGITIGGVTPSTQTVTAQTTNGTGGWSGTFVVPVLTSGNKTVTATTASDTASATFNVSGQEPAPDLSGPANGTSNASTTVTATLTTTEFPDTIVAVVAWEDTGNQTVVVTDATPLVWTSRSQPIAYGSFKIQEWTALAKAAVVGKLVTATFSAAITGRAAISVVGITNSGNTFDSNPGVPTPLTASGTLTGFSTPIYTHLAPELLFGAILVAPQATVTSGSGWSKIDAVNATDFELQTEFLLATGLQYGTAVNWTAASHAYTAVGLADGILSPTSTTAPYSAVDEGAIVTNTNTAATEQGVGYWFYPSISSTGSTGALTVTFNRSVGPVGGLTPLLGTTTSASSTVLTDTALALTVNALKGAFLTYVTGPAAGQTKAIASNTSDTITTPAFSPAPSVGGGDSFNVTGPEGILTETHTSSNNPVVGNQVNVVGTNYWPGTGSKTQVASG